MRTPEAKACVLDVRRTYQFLADRAADAGAEILVKADVRGPLLNESGMVNGVVASSFAEDVEVKAKLVIDASGFHSVVGRKAGLAPEWKRFGSGAEYEARVETVQADTWYLMVGSQYSPAGYAWIFPLGPHRARIGVGIGRPESDVNPTSRLIELLERRPGPLSKLGKISPLEFHSGFIPNEGLRANMVADNLIMVGDSAGMANPLVLEGIRFAIRFGQLAGEVGGDAVKKGATSKQELVAYENQTRKAIASKISAALRVQKRWIGLTDEQWDEEIESTRGLTWEEFLQFTRADFNLANMIRLATSHPRLAARQLYAMVRDSLND